VLARRDAWAVALVATLTMTVSYVDRATFSVLAIEVTKALDISDEAYGWLQIPFNLAYLVATPLAGWWLDRAGARRGLLISVLVWSIVAALHSLVPGFATLFVLRIALGLAEGPGFPGAALTMQRVLPAAERERGFGVLFTGSSIGGMLVPPLASWLYTIGGWRFAFLGTAAVGLLWVPLWVVVTRRARGELDVPAGTTRARSASLREMLASSIVWRALVAVLSAAPIFGFAYSWGAKYLAATFAITQGAVGGYLWLPPLMFDTGAILFGHLASRQRRAPGVAPRGLYAIASLLAACLALLPLAATPWQAMVILGVSMAGGGAQYTLVSADLLSRMPADSVAFAGGTLACAQSFALIIVGPLIGWAVTRYGDLVSCQVDMITLPCVHPSYTVATIAIGIWSLPGAIAWLVWRVPERLR